MQTAIIVSLIAIILAFFSSTKTLKYGLELSMIILTIFVAIRYEWGTDMPSYYLTYQAFADSGFNVFDFDKILQIREGRSLEIGWAMLNVLCRPLGFFGMIILLAIVENFIIYDFIKRNVDRQYYWLAIFIYTMNPYMMVLGCSMLRQWLAMCLLLFAIRFIVDGKWYYYFLFVLLAASIHTSALLFLILYFFKYAEKIKLNITSIAWLCGVSLLWIAVGNLLSMDGIKMLLSTDVFESYTGQMNLEDGSGGGLGFGTFFKLFLYLFCIAHTQYLDRDKRIICWLLFSYILLFPFTDAVSLASRLNFYIDAFAIAVVPIAMKVSRNKTINIILLSLYIFWNLFLYRLFFLSESHLWGYGLYHTIFETTWQ